MKKNSLYESNRKIKKINILVPCRDISVLWPETEQLFISIENYYDISINYIFVENSSEDDTRSLLSEFLAGRTGSCVFLDEPPGFSEWSRTARIGWARNSGLQYLDPSAPWTFFLDAEVFFLPEVLEKLFSKNPSKRNISMLCAYGTHAGIVFDSDAKLRDVVHAGHYYDTYAYTEKSSGIVQNYWPYCTFASCRQCNYKDCSHLDGDNNIRIVNSAFGGLAAVKTEALIDGDVLFSADFEQPLKLHPLADGRKKYNYAELTQFASKHMIEWLAFCEAVANKTAGHIAIATDCPVYWLDKRQAALCERLMSKQAKKIVTFGCWRVDLSDRLAKTTTNL